jgi:fibronectin type 3 domain-containing protein
MAESDTEGIVVFNISNFLDTAGNPGVPSAIFTTDSSIVTFDTTAPGIPALTTQSGDGYVDLNWLSPSTDTDINHYEIYRAYGPFQFRWWASVTAEQLSFRDMVVQNGETYYYYIIAVDQAGNRSSGIPQSITVDGVKAAYPKAAVTIVTQPQPQILSATVETQTVSYIPAAEAITQTPATQGEVKGEEEQQPTEESADTETTTENQRNWPLIIGIILAGLVVLFWAYYWYITWRESKAITTRRKRK